ncbi:MAG: GGDEF domain-containing phosphodiesterase [Lachnospiraceae bacterium]|nr:GGDEF domain-containing phosphodiesterase [Lachnospiraceae bacterium]
MGDKRLFGKTEPVDKYVWNMVMDNGYDCVFGVDINDDSIYFYHVYKRKNPGSAYSKIEKSGEAPVTFNEFMDNLYEFVVEEEQASFKEQLRVDYICNEINERGNFVRTIHMNFIGERKSKSFKIFSHEAEPDKLLGFVYDISASLDHDWMTDEYARLGFLENADRMLQEIPIDREQFSLVYTNIKGFKAINDLFGEQSGDMVIFQTRDILRTLLKPVIMGRLENDHFVLITRDEFLNEQSLRSLASQTYSEGFKQYDFTIRCGIYRIHDREVSIGKMIDRAKLAEKSILENVGRSHVVYNDDVRVNYVKQRVLISDMNKAMEVGEFKAYYQGIVDAKTGQIESAEALVRWEHGRLGMISPGEFIPAFETGGQISSLDRFMIERIIEFNTNRAKECKLIVPCAVNLSRIDFYNTALMDYIVNMYTDNPIATEYVRIEVTESAYADLEKNASDYLNKLKALNVKILLDDYGSGMSSLSTLENFEFDVVKLDMGFIHKIGLQKKAEIIIKSTIELSHALGATVTAEGVETAQQLDFLRDAGCDHIQGFYFYKPMPEEDFSKLLG